MLVWLNGEFVSASDAKVSIFDAGVQHAVGLFETLGARNGRAFRAARHMQRLADSARELMLTERLHIEPLTQAIAQTIERNELEEARIRLTLTGGDLSALPATGRSRVDPTIFIVAQPPTPYPPAFFEQGVRVMIADGRLNPFEPMAGHKTLNYWPRIRALQIAASRQAGEALWFSVSNHVACGSVSNVFLVKDGELLTPIARSEEREGAVPSVVRPGITREAIIDWADGEGVAVHRRMLDIEALLNADEVFLTNSSWGVLPVIGVEKEKIADAEVGPITQRARGGWLAMMEAETAV